jgi:hypothetical protein
MIRFADLSCHAECSGAAYIVPTTGVNKTSSEMVCNCAATYILGSKGECVLISTCVSS